MKEMKKGVTRGSEIRIESEDKGKGKRWVGEYDEKEKEKKEDGEKS